MSKQLFLLTAEDLDGNDYGGLSFEQSFVSGKKELDPNWFVFSENRKINTLKYIDEQGHNVELEITIYKINNPKELYKILKQNELSFDYDALKHNSIFMYEF